LGYQKFVHRNDLIAASSMAQLHDRRDCGRGNHEKRSETGKSIDELQRHKNLPEAQWLRLP
jgi:hypothetical protein